MPASVLSAQRIDFPSGVKTGVMFDAFRCAPNSRVLFVRKSSTAMRDSGPNVLYAIIVAWGLQDGESAWPTMGNGVSPCPSVSMT